MLHSIMMACICLLTNSGSNTTHFQDGQHDLDLSYITGNVIAMSMPADSLNSLFRNRFEAVQAYLNERHDSNYKVFNLCDEYRYSDAKFPNGNVHG